MNAKEELQAYLQPGEIVEKIVFGPWGWGYAPENGQAWKFGFGEPEPPPVPFDVRGKLLTLEQAEPYMTGWGFSGGFGSPDCYATYIWTNKHVIWVAQYDGSTWLTSAPRNPEAVMPGMPGG